jgi:hypothetical protein
MFAGRPAESVDRHSVIRLSLIRLLLLGAYEKGGENNAWTMLDNRMRPYGFGYCLPAGHRNGSRQSWQELPYGTAMPLGEFQENLRLGESMSVVFGTSGCSGTECLLTSEHVRII